MNEPTHGRTDSSNDTDSDGVNGERRLEVNDLRVTYSNGALGVNGATIAVNAGSIVAVLGRNGAGKSSLLQGIAGFLRSERVLVTGQIVMEGHQIGGATPMKTNKLGVVFVPERDKVFPSLRVSDHLRMVSKKDAPDSAFASSFPALERRMTSRAGMLSGGERQMLALAMAAQQNPKLLLVDELSLGLAPVIVKELMAALRRMTDSTRVPVVVVEQDAVAALKVADYIYVMDRGRVVWEGARGSTSAAELGQRYLAMPA